jgi:hypothetical protein
VINCPMTISTNPVGSIASTTFCARPRVWLLGPIDHADFRDAANLLRCGAIVTTAAELTVDSAPPELIVVADSRPGSVDRREQESLRRRAPLASVVSLVGSWCEGELRTGRPIEGVTRLYWHEFPGWWRRQEALRAAGQCPEWIWPNDFGFSAAAGKPEFGLAAPRTGHAGLIVLAARCWETADALADVFCRAGYATVLRRPGDRVPTIHGVTAGVWEGGQLDDREADDLIAFSRRLAPDGAPIIALFDFPRRDSHDRALAAGAAAVLGKPWRNDVLLETVRFVTTHRRMMPRKDAARAA